MTLNYDVFVCGHVAEKAAVCVEAVTLALGDSVVVWALVVPAYEAARGALVLLPFHLHANKFCRIAAFVLDHPKFGTLRALHGIMKLCAWICLGDTLAQAVCIVS